MNNVQFSEPTKPHYRLDAWTISMELVGLIYKWSSSFPSEEKYGLQAQIRRAAVSIPSNIAEGAARSGSKEFAHFLSIARGSLAELETQYLLAVNLGLAEPDRSLYEGLNHVSRLITGLYRRHTTRNL